MSRVVHELVARSGQADEPQGGDPHSLFGEGDQDAGRQGYHPRHTLRQPPRRGGQRIQGHRRGDGKPAGPREDSHKAFTYRSSEGIESESFRTLSPGVSEEASKASDVLMNSCYLCKEEFG